MGAPVIQREGTQPDNIVKLVVRDSAVRNLEEVRTHLGDDLTLRGVGLRPGEREDRELLRKWADGEQRPSEIQRVKLDILHGIVRTFDSEHDGIGGIVKPLLSHFVRGRSSYFEGKPLVDYVGQASTTVDLQMVAHNVAAATIRFFKREEKAA